MVAATSVGQNEPRAVRPWLSPSDTNVSGSIANFAPPAQVGDRIPRNVVALNDKR
jgi:hypothetical protein